MSRHSERVAKYWGTPVPEGIKHGYGTWAKTVYGCDCPVCLPSGRRRSPEGVDPLTHAERQRNLREAKRGQPVPEGTRHGSYAYRVYQCRCEVCLASKETENIRKQNSWRDRARGHWHTELRNGSPIEVIHWPPADRPWVCPECDYKILEDAS